MSSTYAFSVTALPTLVAAAAALFLGIRVLIREQGSRVNVIFFVMTLPVALWLFAFSWMYCATEAQTALWWAKAAYLGVPLIPAAAYHFTVAVLQLAPQRRRLVGWGWALAALFVALALGTDQLIIGMRQYWWGYYPQYGWLAVPYLLFFAGMVGASLHQYWVAARQAVPGSTHQRRVRTFFFGFAIALAASVDFLAKYGIPCYPVGYAPLLVFLAVAAHAIWRYHLADVTPFIAAHHIIDTMFGAMLVTDLAGRIRFSNRIAHQLLGYQHAELFGRPVAVVAGPAVDGELHPQRLSQAEPVRGREMVWRAKDGRLINVSISASVMRDLDHQPTGIVYVALDLTQHKRAEELQAAYDEIRQQRGELQAINERLQRANTDLMREIAERHRVQESLKDLTVQLEAANVRLEQLVMVDPLTELLNRRGIQRALSRELAWTRREGVTLLAMLVDVDDFKHINDTLGHVVGDMVLKEMARKLQDSLRVTDHVARVGGDEFVVLLPRTRLAEGIQVAEKVRLAISGMPVPIAAGRTVNITASVGLVTVSPTTPSIDELLSQTNAVLHRSKAAGKNRVSSDASDQAADRTRSDLLAMLRAGDRFHVLMQPIFHLPDRKIVGYEMLSRLPAMAGFEMPDDFFRICLEANILTLVDHKCLAACVAASVALPPQFRRHLNLFPSTLINIPAHHLVDMFPADRREGMYCIEISEQQIIGEPSYLAEPVAALKQAGILIAIDDVGFGRSSLESLVHLEPNIVKIDKRCVFGIAHDPLRARSLRRLLKVARVLGTEVIAEGIEVPGDLALLRTLGVVYGQGYLLGRPDPCPVPPRAPASLNEFLSLNPKSA